MGALRNTGKFVGKHMRDQAAGSIRKGTDAYTPEEPGVVARMGGAKGRGESSRTEQALHNATKKYSKKSRQALMRAVRRSKD